MRTLVKHSLVHHLINEVGNRVGYDRLASSCTAAARFARFARCIALRMPILCFTAGIAAALRFSAAA